MTKILTSPKPAHPESRGVVSKKGWTPSLLTIFGIMLLTLLALRLQGRVWYCPCGTWWAIFKGDVWSSHCSQHPLDPYSVTHMSHGLLFWCALAWLAPRLAVQTRLVVSVSIACAWEIAENSSYVIDRYRTVTMSLDYLGDSVTNAMFDIACCALGFFVARRLGIPKTLMLFLITEIALLILVRDNLTLNVLMLIYPVESVKAWQSVGHALPGAHP